MDLLHENQHFRSNLPHRNRTPELRTQPDHMQARSRTQCRIPVGFGHSRRSRGIELRFLCCNSKCSHTTPCSHTRRGVLILRGHPADGLDHTRRGLVQPAWRRSRSESIQRLGGMLGLFLDKRHTHVYMIQLEGVVHVARMHRSNTEAGLRTGEVASSLGLRAGIRRARVRKSNLSTAPWWRVFGNQMTTPKSGFTKTFRARL
mmetsp:Transcript_3129/g.6150  ORF Transcript_3129/g.6150 Transcript_3129/m.6150 type:complete len:203 (+) Transcript_3129:1275-1883(+)